MQQSLGPTRHRFQGVSFYLFSATTVRIHLIPQLLTYWMYFSIELYHIITSLQAKEGILKCELSLGLITFFFRLDEPNSLNTVVSNLFNILVSL